MKSTLKKRWGRIALCLCMANFACAGMAQTNKKLDDQVINTMKTATQFMMDKVSYNGGFVWNYLPDMSRSWGEMEAKRTMVWIQPPGTPSVGHLLLDAYHATGDEYYYEAAQKVANTLIWGQLECGGWNYVFDFAGENSLKSWYDTVGTAWIMTGINLDAVASVAVADVEVVEFAEVICSNGNRIIPGVL